MIRLNESGLAGSIKHGRAKKVLFTAANHCKTFKIKEQKNILYGNAELEPSISAIFL